jgi:hypothetical protein
MDVHHLETRPPSFWFVLSLLFELSLFLKALSCCVSSIPGRTLFVITRPNESVTFFAPSILRSETAFVLSLSSGSPNGSAREFFASCQVLGTPGRCFLEKRANDSIRSAISKYTEILLPDRIVTFDRDDDPAHTAVWGALLSGASPIGTDPSEFRACFLGIPIYTLGTSPSILTFTGVYGAVAQALTGDTEDGFFAMTPPFDLLSFRLERAFLEYESQQAWGAMASIALSRLAYFNHLVPLRFV